jgi:O-antigen ligase
LLLPCNSPRQTKLQPSRRRGSWAILALCGFAVLCVVAAVGIGRGRYDIADWVAVIFATPLLLTAGLRWPYLFPYGLYVALVPFDNLLLLGSGGTLTKILGTCSGVVIAASLFRRRRLVRPSRSLWWWFAFILWLGTTLLWTQDVQQGETAAIQIASIVLLFALLSSAPISEHELRTLCACIVFGGVAAALYGIYLFHDPSFVNDPTGEGRLMISLGGQRVDPNHLANSLLLPFSLSIVALIRARKPGWLLLHFGCVASIGTVIVLTASREALIGCVLVLGTVVVFSRRRLLAAAITICGTVTAPVVFPLILVRFQEGVAEQGSARNYVWHVVWLSIQQHPFFGWGVGSGIVAYDANYLAVSAPLTSYWNMSPHNSVLYLILELGVIGAALWLCAYFATFLQISRIHADDALFDLRIALTAAFVGISFVMLFIDLTDYKYLWLLLGTLSQLRSVLWLRNSSMRPVISEFEPQTHPGTSVRATPLGDPAR